MKYSQKYGRPGNSTTYCSDTVMLYIIKTQETDGQGMHPSLRRVTLISQELPRYNPYIQSIQNLQCSTMQPHRIQNWEGT